jgi:hypothetical protein
VLIGGAFRSPWTAPTRSCRTDGGVTTAVTLGPSGVGDDFTRFPITCGTASRSSARRARRTGDIPWQSPWSAIGRIGCSKLAIAVRAAVLHIAKDDWLPGEFAREPMCASERTRVLKGATHDPKARRWCHTTEGGRQSTIAATSSSTRQLQSASSSPVAASPSPGPPSSRRRRTR